MINIKRFIYKVKFFFSRFRKYENKENKFIYEKRDEDIDDKITNLCRCGTYVRVRKAIHKSAELMKHQKN